MTEDTRPLRGHESRRNIMKNKRKATTLAVVGLSALLLAPTAAFAAAPTGPPAPTTSYSASVTIPATGQVNSTSSGYIDFVNHSSHTAYLYGPMHSARGNWYWTAPFASGQPEPPANNKNPDSVTVPAGQEIGVDLTHTTGSFQGSFRLKDDDPGGWIAYNVSQAGNAPALVTFYASSEQRAPGITPTIHVNDMIPRSTYTISDGA